MQQKIAANSMMGREKEEYQSAMQILQNYGQFPDTDDLNRDFTKIKKDFDKSVKQHEKQIKSVQNMLECAFTFIKKVWGDSQEMVLFLTELTSGMDSMFFINQWGSDSYFHYNQELLTYDQEEKLGMEIREILDL